MSEGNWGGGEIPTPPSRSKVTETGTCLSDSLLPPPRDKLSGGPNRGTTAILHCAVLFDHFAG